LRWRSLVYVRSFADFNFWRIDTSAPGTPSTSAPKMAIGSTKIEYHIRLSPDGRRAAFGSGRSGDVELWLSDLDGSNTQQLYVFGRLGHSLPCLVS
jgi:Tol biopolymer transport system component